MTDSERDQIDQDAQIFMRTCSEAIKQLRNEGVCFNTVQLDLRCYWELKICRQVMLVLFCTCRIHSEVQLSCVVCKNISSELKGFCIGGYI